jgi:hypothetical protein
MQHAKRCQRDRFITRWLMNIKPRERKQFAHAIEADIIDRLRAAGYCVSRSGANGHYDLLVDGLRIEVKAATLSGGRYQANLRSNDADILIFVCRDADGLDHHFVLDFADVRDLTHIEIHNAAPAAYRGWMAYGYDAWQLIDIFVARGVNHLQMALL